MHFSKEEQILFQHFNDMINLSYQRGIPVYSHFVSLREMTLVCQALDIFYDKKWQEGKQAVFYGGYSEAERKMVCFLPAKQDNFCFKPDFSISCVRIMPANKKFCDKLNHRDYLGTIMSLGLTRDQIGDIVVKNEGNDAHQAATAYVFCKSDKADLLTELNRIKHTTVIAEIISCEELEWTPEFKEISGSVSSFRFDAVLSLAINVSRSQGLALIQEGSVFLNGRCCTENAKKLVEGDVFSIRGYGKFIFEKVSTMSKKGRFHIIVKQYI